MKAELVLYNGAVYTMDPQQPRAEALAICQDRVAAVGRDEEMCQLLGPGGRRVDLKGRCVIPGLVDAHLHFESMSLGLERLNAELSTVEEVQAAVRERAGSLAPGEWIRGHGWNHNRWGGQFPMGALLDAAAPEHPVFLTAKSGHAAWVNGKAMEVAGVDGGTPDPADGALVRTSAGEPTGILLEGASGLVSRAIPEPGLDEATAAMRRGMDRALALGLTGVVDLDGTRALRAWQVLREAGDLRLRVCKSVPYSLLDETVELGLRSGFGDEWLKIVGVKLFADGALGPCTAWMLEPYEGEPDNVGMPLMTREELAHSVEKAGAAGLACLTHAIGDRANREVLDALQVERERERAGGRTPLRHRIEHVQILHPDDLPRLAELGVVASMQPIHATSDMAMADRVWGERAAGAYAFRSLLDRGTLLAFGSDSPVEPLDPLVGIHAAVTRRGADGAPAAEGWYPQERLTVEQAVRAYTADAAFASGEEALKGRLTPGRLADCVVLDRDIFLVPPMEILNTRVEATFVAGVCAYAADGFDGDLI